MQRLSFRSTGGAHPTYLYTFANTVQVGTGVESQTGVSWYVFNQAGVRHSGIINPGDSNYRFMPSAAMDKAGNVAVGYSASGYSLHPAMMLPTLTFRTDRPRRSICSQAQRMKRTPSTGGFTRA